MLVKYEEIKKYDDISTYEDLNKALNKNYRDYYICRVDNSEMSLAEKIIPKKDVEFQDKNTKWGYKAYTETLSLIFTMACKRLFPEHRADLNHYLGSGLYIDFDDNSFCKTEEINALSVEMQKIIDQDLKIEIQKIDRKKAMEKFEKSDEEVASLLKTIEKPEVSIAKIEEYEDINHSILMPSTGYIDSFRLMEYYPGILLIAPSEKNDFDVENYNEMPKLAKNFQRSTNIFKSLKLNKLYSINEQILNGEAEKIIKISEIIFDRNMFEIADNIKNDEDVKLILISGPTSSGKTTFTKRLKSILEAYGYFPIMISMDDYFLDRADTPKDENGKLDLESIYSINLKMFNEDMRKLFNSEKIFKRKFDFISGKGFYSDEYIIPKAGKHPIIVEGIHAFNPEISKLIPDKNKYKIYISALNQVNIDAHNRFSTSDTRFIRRVVRDFNFRGYSVEHTFELWENVRLSEEENLFKFQEDANYILNTALPYETNILKKHIYPHLLEIGKDSPYYSEAKKLIELLDYFVSIEDDNLVNSESILREFIGKI